MSRYRNALPQLAGTAFISDGGLETTLIYHRGIELPLFAAFVLLDDADGRRELFEYYRGYAGMARRHRRGLVLESPTWRANADWGARLGYDAGALAQLNRDGVRLMEEIRERYETRQSPMVISACVGPRGDGYVADSRMSAAEAADYHGAQIATFAATAADMVSAFTINYVEEAVGIVRAAQAQAMPVAISFTLETDGRLPSGQPLAEAIRETDAATAGGPHYYMINCAHPTHFEHVLDDAHCAGRIRGLRANASCRSHAELDAATELDAGDPLDLGARYRALRARLPGLAVVGGCCGTDHRHVEAICTAFDR